MIDRFDAAVRLKLQDLGEATTPDEQYDRMCVAITHVIQDTIPDRGRPGRTRRVVSERTKTLFEKHGQIG